MCHATAFTFVIGPAAAEAVGRQIGRVELDRRQRAELWQRTTNELAGLVHRRLCESPDGFVLLIGERPGDDARLVWEGCNHGAGLLYVVQRRQLQSISLLLRSDGSPADAAMDRIERLLKPIEPYLACLGTIRAASKPVIATFCSAAGGFDRATEISTTAFASVLFSGPAVPTGTSSPDPSTRAPVSWSRGRGG